MTVDHNHIVALLKTASAYDNRKPDPASVLAWAEAAKRGHWTFERAKDAIHHHYANSTERIMPGHVTAHHRVPRLRASDVSVDEALQLAPVPATAERRDELMTQIRALADRKGMPR